MPDIYQKRNGDVVLVMPDYGDRVTAVETAVAGKANASHGTHVTFSTTAPKVAGTAAVGTATTVSRSDHVHPAQTSVSGNAGTATKLAAAKTITLSGDISGSVSFDGSENVTLTATVADDSHAHTIANIDNLQTTLNAKAPLASPALTGTPTAPTAAAGTNTTQIATTAFVQTAVVNKTSVATATKATQDGSGNVITTTYATKSELETAAETAQSYTDTAIANLVNSAPETLDTLGELATALSDNVEVTDALNEAIGTKANSSEVVKLSGNQTIAGTKTFSSTISGSVSGNAGTATKLASAKTITLSGDVSGSVSFDGSDNVTLTATVADDSHNHTIANVDGLQTALDGKANSSHGTHVTFSTTAPKAAGTAAVGTATTVSRSDHVHPAQTTVSGNAGTATKLASAVSIALSGDVSGSVDFDGSEDITITTTVADDSHAHTIANVDGLQTALDGKANSSHGTHVTFSTTAPKVAGTAAVGTATTVSRSDHVHPVQTSVSGNAGTATKLAEARTIAISGGATGTATSFDGSANISIPVTALDMSKASAGTLAVARGGTGVTANPSMLVNLASTTAASVFAASPRPGVTGILPVANGGTGNKNGIAPKATADASGNTITTTYATKTELTTAITNTELVLTTPITAGSTVTVPSYTVGKGNINVYIDGVRCTRGDTFSEVGTSGAASTSVKFNDAISADYEVIAISG